MEQQVEQPALKIPHTSCKKCVFAQYTGKTQTGCLKGKLEVFREQGVVIEAHDDEKEFDIINGRACQYYRPHDHKWAHVYQTLAEREARVEEEVQVRPAAFIYTNEDTSVRDVKVTVENLLEFGPQVHSITLLLRPSKIVPNDAYNLLNSYPDIVWSVNDTPLNKPKKLEDPGLREGHDHVGYQLETAIRSSSAHRTKARWTLVAEAGKTLPLDTLKNINTYLNQRLLRFGVYGDDVWHGLMFNNQTLATLVDGPSSIDYAIGTDEEKTKVTYHMFDRLKQVQEDYPDTKEIRTNYEGVAACV